MLDIIVKSENMFTLRTFVGAVLPGSPTVPYVQIITESTISKWGGISTIFSVVIQVT